ncbi:MAG: YkvA family protein [Jiangellaceae bacterium]
MAKVGRTAAFVALWRYARGSIRPGSPGLAIRIKALPRLVPAVLSGRWSELGRGRLALMGLAVLYVLSPVDLMPEGVFLALGLVDDAVVVSWLAGSVIDATDRFIAWERVRPQVVDGRLAADG